MDMGWLLATAEEGGISLNFNILETNLINLVIVITVLVYFGSKFLGKTLSGRQAAIEQAIGDAEARRAKAVAELAEQQQNLAQAQKAAKEILAKAEEMAAKAKADILAQADADVERMKATAAQDVSSQEAKVMRELQQRIAELAIAKAEADLPSRLDDGVQQRLVDSSIALLKGGN